MCKSCRWQVRKAFTCRRLPAFLALTFEPTYSRSRLQMNVFSWRTWAATCICSSIQLCLHMDMLRN
jgi:hypothetical protein